MKLRTVSIALCFSSLLIAAEAGNAAELAGVALGTNTSTLAGLGKSFTIGDKQATGPWKRLDLELPDGRFLRVYAKDDIIMHIEIAAKMQLWRRT